MCLGLAGCGGGQATSSTDPDPSPSSTEASVASDTSPSKPGETSGELGEHTVTIRFPAGRFREDYGQPGRLHLLPVDVSMDPKKERWGDIFVMAPTAVYHPRTQETQPLPANPVAWLRAHPKETIVREHAMKLPGGSATVFDLDRSGSELFGDDTGGLEGDGTERLVLWEHDGTWFLAQASTFRGRAGLLAPDRRDDALVKVLRTFRTA